MKISLKTNKRGRFYRAGVADVVTWDVIKNMLQNGCKTAEIASKVRVSTSLVKKIRGRMNRGVDNLPHGKHHFSTNLSFSARHQKG